jgi:hypothetical protein
MKKIGEFRIRTAKGQEFIVVERQEEIPAADLENPDDVLMGLRSLRTREGWAVTELGEGIYEIVQFGLKARKVS